MHGDSNIRSVCTDAGTIQSSNEVSEQRSVRDTEQRSVRDTEQHTVRDSQ
jgi:hypothetical protein